MDDHKKDRESIIGEIREIKSQLKGKQVRKLQIDRLERIVGKLEQYAQDCEECGRLLGIIGKEAIPKLRSPDEGKQKEYRRYLNSTLTHLLRGHNLVTEGYYTSTYLVLGIALGLLFGLALGNSALGIPIGLAIGVAIGSGLDAVARKKGNAI
jgi:hypothetical protein